MNVKSKLIKIYKNDDLTSKYIEDELRKMGINPLRWSIVDVDSENYTVSVADLLH